MNLTHAATFLAIDDPWPTTDVLAKLTEAAEHLLRDHSCDAHGWEEVARAAAVARERLEAFAHGSAGT